MLGFLGLRRRVEPPLQTDFAMAAENKEEIDLKGAEGRAAAVSIVLLSSRGE